GRRSAPGGSSDRARARGGQGRAGQEWYEQIQPWRYDSPSSPSRGPQRANTSGRTIVSSGTVASWSIASETAPSGQRCGSVFFRYAPAPWELRYRSAQSKTRLNG